MGKGFCGSARMGNKFKKYEENIKTSTNFAQNTALTMVLKNGNMVKLN